MLSRLVESRTAAFVAGALTLGTLAGGVGAAAQEVTKADSPTITMCVSRLGADVRFVYDAAQCVPGEVVQTWNREGPVGPQGPQGPKGDTGASGPRGRDGERGSRGPAGRSVDAPFHVELAFGETEEIVTNGPLTLTASCTQGTSNFGLGDEAADIVRILASTTADGTLMSGADTYYGQLPNLPDRYLNDDTAADDREVVKLTTRAGLLTGLADIDEAWLLAPSGEAIHLNSEGLVLATNFGDSDADCIIAGVYAVTDSSD